MIGSIINWFLRIFCSIIAACWCLQYHPSAQRYLRTHLFAAVATPWQVTIECEKCHINCIAGRIYLSDVTVIDNVIPSTRWHISQGTISLSLLDYLCTSSIGIYIDVQDFSGLSTTYNSELSLKSHFDRLVTSSSSMPVQVQAIRGTGSSVTVSTDTMYTLSGPMSLYTNFDAYTNQWQGTFELRDAALSRNQSCYAHRLTATTAWTFFSSTDTYTWQLHYAGILSLLPSQLNSITGIAVGSSNKISGTATCNNHTDISWIFSDTNITGSCITRYPTFSGELFGTGNFQYHFDTERGNFTSSWQLAQKAHASLLCDIHHENLTASAELTHQGFHNTRTSWKSSFVYSTTAQHGTYSCINTTPFQWPECGAISKTAMITGLGTINRSGSHALNVHAHWVDRIFERSHRAQGSLITQADAFSLNVRNRKHLLSAQGIFTAPLYALTGSYSFDGHLIATLTTHPNTASGKLTGYLASIQHLNDYFSALPGLAMQGALTYSFAQHGAGHLTGTMTLADGFIRTQDYAVTITALHGTCAYDYLMHQFSMYDLTFYTQQGHGVIPYATLFVDHAYTPSFVHGSLLLHGLNIQWHQEARATLDAIINYQHAPPQLPRIDGTLFVRDSILKGSSLFESKSSAQLCNAYIPGTYQARGIELDLHIKTENPLTCATPALQTQADIVLHLAARYMNGYLHTPALTGAIRCLQGKINFLKHTLTITRGQAEFLPHRPYDPQIECIAHTRIKQYLISLYVTGAASKPHISFSSVPHLSQEQIIAMLIAGSSTLQLQQDLPTILLQNLHGMFNGYGTKKAPTSSFLKALTKPFEYIQITPQISTQTGRGGIKATLSIDVNPQLHAHMQKDFSLQEDLAIDVEYFLSDDINLRVAKDARGDIGAEAEIRCKFS